MKKNILAIFAVAALSMTSCKKEATTSVDTNVDSTAVNTATPVEGTAFAVVPADSKIDWEGGKISGDKHFGTISVQEGKLLMNEGKLVGGNFVIDMNSIVVTDITDAEKKAKLEGHLKGNTDDAESADHFFNVKTYPTATFDIKNVTEENGQQIVEGDFTLKGKTNPVKFPATITETAEGITLKADNISIDRTKWGVNYASGTVVTDLAADKVIKDDITLKALVVAKK